MSQPKLRWSRSHRATSKAPCMTATHFISPGVPGYNQSVNQVYRASVYERNPGTWALQTRGTEQEKGYGSIQEAALAAEEKLSGHLNYIAGLEARPRGQSDTQEADHARQSQAIDAFIKSQD